MLIVNVVVQNRKIPVNTESWCRLEMCINVKGKLDVEEHVVAFLVLSFTQTLDQPRTARDLHIYIFTDICDSVRDIV